MIEFLESIGASMSPLGLPPGNLSGSIQPLFPFLAIPLSQQLVSLFSELLFLAILSIRVKIVERVIASERRGHLGIHWSLRLRILPGFASARA
jgi:hypothetical protein